MIKKFNDFINEGFNTYSISKLRYFLKRCGLKQPEDFYEMYDGVLKIKVKPKYVNKYNSIIHSIENIYGWYLSSIYDTNGEKIKRNNIDFKIPDIDAELVKYISKNNLNINDVECDEFDYEIYSLVFEQKTGTPIDYDKIPDIIYHITDTMYLDKILNMGLVPKSKSKKTYHPERIYLTKIKSQCNSLFNHPEFGIENPVIFSIDKNKLEDKNIFIYRDPYLSDGVFVINNIPKDCIINYFYPEF
jgi:hypothetical protein